MSPGKLENRVALKRPPAPTTAEILIQWVWARLRHGSFLTCSQVETLQLASLLWPSPSSPFYAACTCGISRPSAQWGSWTGLSPCCCHDDYGWMGWLGVCPGSPLLNCHPHKGSRPISRLCPVSSLRGHLEQRTPSFPPGNVCMHH